MTRRRKTRTHYDNLKVAPNASPKEIKLAYRRLVQRYHPDKYRGDKKEAERITKLINEAREVLSDPVRRKAHDEWIASERQEGTPEPSSRTRPAGPQQRAGAHSQYRDTEQRQGAARDWAESGRQNYSSRADGWRGSGRYTAAWDEEGAYWEENREDYWKGYHAAIRQERMLEAGMLAVAIGVVAALAFVLIRYWSHIAPWLPIGFCAIAIAIAFGVWSSERDEIHAPVPFVLLALCGWALFAGDFNRWHLVWLAPATYLGTLSVSFPLNLMINSPFLAAFLTWGAAGSALYFTVRWLSV